MDSTLRPIRRESATTHDDRHRCRTIRRERGRPGVPAARVPRPRHRRAAASAGADIHRALTYSMPDGYRPLQLDLYVPAERAGAVPCVIWIHGGAWLFGTRLAPPDYWPAGYLFQAAIDAGLAVASIDYRHSREASFPAQLHDAKAAIRYLRHFAGELGIDPGAVRCVGRVGRRPPRRARRADRRPGTRGRRGRGSDRAAR